MSVTARDRTHLAVEDSLLPQSSLHPVTLLQGEQGRGPQVDEALPGHGDADHEEYSAEHVIVRQLLL